MTEKKRCGWVPKNDALYREYHDKEWGVPVHDEHLLFEFIILEGAQAGLSWATILKKREHYREVYDHFDPQKVAAYGPDKVDSLLNDPGIVRNRLKVNASIENAKAFLKIQEDYGSFDNFIWRFVKGKPLQNRWNSLSEVPAKSEVSDDMSKSLKKLGFKFVGSTICYAFMQAAGLVNDHTVECFRYQEVAKYRQRGTIDE